MALLLGAILVCMGGYGNMKLDCRFTIHLGLHLLSIIVV